MATKLKPLNAEQILYLGGQYEALAWVLTSPRLRGYLYDVIHDRALKLKARLEAAGEKFTPLKVESDEKLQRRADSPDSDFVSADDFLAELKSKKGNYDGK